MDIFRKKPPPQKTVDFPTTFEALIYLRSDECKFFYDKSTEFHYKILSIEEELKDAINDMNFAKHFSSRKSVLIAFHSTSEKNECKIFWKVPKGPICLLEIKECEQIFINFCLHSILEGINLMKTGYVKRLPGNVHLLTFEKLTGGKKINLLILAAKNNRPDIVRKLLEYEFDLNCEDSFCMNAIDYAWENYIEASRNGNEREEEESNEIILCLLNKSSKFPSKKVKFRPLWASREVQDILDLNREMKKYILNEMMDKLEEMIKKHPKLHHFYDETNTSLKAYAIKMNNLTALGVLAKFGIKTGNHEKLEVLYKNLEKKDFVLHRNINLENSHENPSVHIHELILKSKIISSDERHDHRWPYVYDAFEILNLNLTCSLVLKIAARWDELKIVFDFTQETTYHVDPSTSMGTTGTIYDSGTIIIAAKNLMNECKKYQVIGVLIHELYHCAVLLTYMNNFNPYPVGESEEKIKYAEIFNKIKEGDDKSEDIVSTVFYYDKDEQHSELIVRPMQMEIHYHERARKLVENQTKFGELYEYNADIVVKEFEKAVDVLQILFDESKDVKFSELTEPMKLNILNSNVNFQGEEILFTDIIGDDQSVLDNLSSAQIRSVLVENLKIDISDGFDKREDMEVIARTLIKRGTESATNQLNIEEITFEKIADSVKISKVFILAEEAGDGKTVYFEDLAIKLKQRNKACWVSLLKLADSYEKLKECRNSKPVNTKDILTKILNLESDIDKAAFEHLYRNSKLILLFDGFDEVDADLKELLLKILLELKKKTQNQVWISTRPHHVEELESTFQSCSYKFAPWSIEQKIKYIDGILKNSNKSHEDLAAFIGMLEKHRHEEQHPVDNALMIEIIAQTFAENEIDGNLNQIDFCRTFEKIIEKYENRSQQKIKADGHVKGSKFNYDKVHEVFALIEIFSQKCEKDLKCSIKNMAIMKNWTRDRKKYWPDHKILRPGMLTAEPSHNDNEHLIDFIHKIYAELFVVKHIISYMYESGFEIKDEEFKNVFNLMRFVVKPSNDFNIIYKILLDYVNNKDEEIFEGMNKILTENLQIIYGDIRNSEYGEKLLEFWSKVLKKNSCDLKLEASTKFCGVPPKKISTHESNKRVNKKHYRGSRR